MTEREQAPVYCQRCGGLRDNGNTMASPSQGPGGLRQEVPSVVVGLEGEDGGAEEEEDDQEQAGHLQTVLSLHQTEPG